MRTCHKNSKYVQCNRWYARVLTVLTGPKHSEAQLCHVNAVPVPALLNEEPDPSLFRVRESAA